MCVGAIALAGINGFDAQAKKKRTNKKVAKTEQVAPATSTEQAQPECQAPQGCEKSGETKQLKKVQAKGLKMTEGRELKKGDCKELMKGECDKKAGECDKKAGECGKKAGDCKEMKGECKGGECKGGEHKCAHQSPCCKEGPCKQDGSCGKPKCKEDKENCCK